MSYVCPIENIEISIPCKVHTCMYWKAGNKFNCNNAIIGVEVPHKTVAAMHSISQLEYEFILKKTMRKVTMLTISSEYAVFVKKYYTDKYNCDWNSVFTFWTKYVNDGLNPANFRLLRKFLTKYPFNVNRNKDFKAIGIEWDELLILLSCSKKLWNRYVKSVEESGTTVSLVFEDIYPKVNTSSLSKPRRVTIKYLNRYIKKSRKS